MGWDTGFKCVSTEKWCFSFITLHPRGVQLNTTGFILLKIRLYPFENGSVEVGNSYWGEFLIRRYPRWHMATEEHRVCVHSSFSKMFKRAGTRRICQVIIFFRRYNFGDGNWRLYMRITPWLEDILPHQRAPNPWAYDIRNHLIF